MAANARLARMLDSLKINPQFSISAPAVGFSHLETAIYMIVFGDRKDKTAVREQVDFFFGEFALFFFLSPPPFLVGKRGAWGIFCEETKES